jgi:hypothetical protein
VRGKITGMITPEMVESVIASWNSGREHIFLVIDNDDGRPFGLPASWYPELGLRLHLIENDELSKALSAYMVDSGFRQFKSLDDLWLAGKIENWPGWETCLDARRDKEFDSAPAELD